MVISYGKLTTIVSFMFTIHLPFSRWIIYSSQRNFRAQKKQNALSEENNYLYQREYQEFSLQLYKSLTDLLRLLKYLDSLHFNVNPYPKVSGILRIMWYIGIFLNSFVDRN